MRSVPPHAPHVSPCQPSSSQFANSVPREFWLLLGRAWRQASRNKLLIVREGPGLVGALGLILSLSCVCVSTPQSVAIGFVATDRP